MTCELISVGTEILLGDIVNTNAQYLSKKLAALGIDVLFQHTVGDNPQRLKATLDLAFSQCEMIILTGGLGPTPDDLTKEVCAEYFGLELVEDKKSLEKIEEYYKTKNLPMPPSNKKQAMMPEGCLILENSCGTAPGCVMEKNGKAMIILPGPPREMKPMFELAEKKYLSKFTHGVIKSHNVRTFAIGESAMAEKVSDLLFLKNPTVAPYAKNGEALLRVTAKAENEEEAEKLLSPVIEEIEKRLGDYIYGIDVDSLAEATVSLLKEKKLTVATAESCTAGLVSKRITDVSGSSAVFGCAVVSYSNEIKEKVLGVKKSDLEKYGAVSETVALQMARGALEISGADIAASVTGLAGPDSDETGKEVGLVYIAVTNGKKEVCKKLLTGHKDRENCRPYNRNAAALNVLNEIRLFTKENY